MEWIDEINKENFDESFNLKNILTNSVYYPASGIDGRAIEGLSNYSFSFVHTDYSIPQTTVETALRNHFHPVGYELIGLKYISREELTPNGFTPHDFTLKESEKQRMHFLHDSIRNFTPFALWAVYELESNHKSENKANKFSLLHIGGEACATFDALYLGNKINPLAITILNPGEGYGDNWTIFRNPDYRFYRLIEYNVNNNQLLFPRYLFTNMDNEKKCFWPNYNFLNKNNLLSCNLYQCR